MNVPAFLLATLLVAAPAGYVALTSDDAPHPTTTADSRPEDVSDLVRVHVEHEGTTTSARIVHHGPDGDGSRRVSLSSRMPLIVDLLVGPGEHEIGLAIDAPGLLPGGATGASPANASTCPERAVEVRFETHARASGHGIRVLEAQCIPRPDGSETMRHEGVEEMGLEVHAPYPTCPTQCRFGYGLLGAPGPEFVVHEGARTIDVRATWEATLPTTRELSIWLYIKDDECGNGCFMGVAGTTGSGEVDLRVDDPAPGLYRVGASPTGPAAVVVQQDVWFEVLVGSS